MILVVAVKPTFHNVTPSFGLEAGGTLLTITGVIPAGTLLTGVYFGLPVDTHVTTIQW